METAADGAPAQAISTLVIEMASGGALALTISTMEIETEGALTGVESNGTQTFSTLVSALVIEMACHGTRHW